MRGYFVVKTQNLSEISERFSEARRTADMLSSYLQRAKMLDLPEKAAEYNKLIRRVDALADFFGKMHDAANSTADDVSDIIRRFAAQLEENIDDMQQLLRKNYYH